MELLHLQRSTLFLFMLLVKGLDCIYDEEGPSFFEEPPFRVDFLNEKGMTVNCSAKGRPKPMITWSNNDGTPLFDVPGLRYVAPNGALVFNPFPAESYRPDVHLGMYRCIAANSFGTIVSRDMRLRAVVKESFEPQVHNVRAVKDFPVIIQCVVPNLLRDFVSVTSWIYGSLNILPSSGLDSQNFVMLDDGQLLIWQVSTKDSYSSYQCRTYHRLTGETSVSSPAKLIVTEGDEGRRPVIEHKGNNVNVIVKENERVVLPCISYGHPRPIHKWLKREGGRLTPVIDDMSDDLRLSSRHNVDSSGLFIRHGALIFNSVRVGNKGNYICNVSNVHGSDSVEIHLTVRSGLTVNLQPEKSTVDLGKNVEFSCFASGEPPPMVQWMKDGRPLRPGNTAGRIRFIGPSRIQVVGVQREDQGIYQCVAKNDYETVQSSAQLWLGDSPPKFLYRFIEQSLQPGPAISLKCSASGNPTPQISWLLDGFELPKSDRFLMGQYANVYGDVISHVNITSVQVEDGGLYECIASNRAGKESHTAALNIYGSPHARTVAEITAVAGKRMRFKCPVGGYPIESVIFIKDGKKLTSGSRHEIRDGSLYVESTERVDEGTYTCRAENKQGQSSETTVKIRVIAAIKVSKFSFEDGLIADRGMRTQVICAATEGEPDQISWLKDNVELQPGSATTTTGHPSAYTSTLTTSANPIYGISIDRFGHFSSILTIVNVSSVHSGRYKCTLANKYGQTSHQAQLIVRVPPKFVVEPKDQHITVGAQVLIDCQAEGMPRPKIHWKQLAGSLEKKEFREVGYRTPGVLAVENGTLIISRVTEDHAGYYACIASQPSGTEHHSAQQPHHAADLGTEISKVIHLLVNVPPRIKARPPKEIVKRGDTAILRCEITGDQPNRVSWFVRGVRLMDNMDSRYSVSASNDSSELTIRDVTPEDAGDFECFANNAYGQDQIWISLLVQERPKTPRNFHLTEKGSRTVMLAWSSPENPETTVLNYVVSFKEESENWEEHRTRKKSISGDHYSMTVKNLLPATTYEFRLFARNSQGNSDPSPVLQVRTDSEPPSGPPSDVTAEATSSSEIRLVWKPPRREDWNGQLLGYNIRYRNARDDLGAYNWTRLEIEFHDLSTPMSKFISKLDKYEEYHFTVQAYNEKGPGPYSNPVAATTMEDVPSAPPENIHCSPLTPHSLQISWYPPPRNFIHGILQGFRIYVEQLPGTESHHQSSLENLAEFESKVPAASMSTIMHNFLPWTNYSVQVTGFTRVGHGVESVPIYCQTKESVPSEPSAIKAVASSIESVIVSWLPPKTPNGLLVKFNVYIRISGAGREIRTVKRNLPSHVLHYEVTDLKRRESYEAWVTAETSAGEGQSTISVPFAAPPSVHLPASIVSFGTVIWTAGKTDVTFPCHHVGNGVLIQWFKRDAKITESARVQLLPNGSLGITSVEKGDSGNISCAVKNLYGSDQITYLLKVQVAPTPPLLHATVVTNSSVRLQWKQGDNGGAPMMGFTLIYRRDGGEWEEVSISRKFTSYEVDSLSCGRTYEFFLTGFNAIGSSEPSEVIRVGTRGSRAIIPPVEEFLQSDSTSIKLNFSSWANLTGECPITRYTVEYKTEGTNWISVAGDTKGLVEINQLSPEMEYKVKVTAFNAAGSTSGEFLVSTSLYKGGLISSNLSRQVPFYKDPYIIAPIVASLASVILAAAGVILCWKRKNFVGSDTMDRRTNLALAATERDYTVIRAKYFPECDRFPDTADDIYPYATFQLAEPEKTNLTGNLPESYLYGTTRFQTAETLPIQTNPRGTLRGTAKRRKSRSRNNRNENGKGGESDEYDSLHSDSDAVDSPRRMGARCSGRGADVLHGTLGERGRRRQKSSYEEDVLAPYLEETSFVYARGSPGLGDFPPRHLRSELNNQRNCDMNAIGQRKSEPLYQALETSIGPKMSQANFKKNFLRTDARESDLPRHQDYTIAV